MSKKLLALVPVLLTLVFTVQRLIYTLKNYGLKYLYYNRSCKWILYTTLTKTVESGKVQPEKLITHHFEMDDMLEAYEVFGNAAQEGTLKVIISNDK